jgi:hypothetical protein
VCLLKRKTFGIKRLIEKEETYIYVQATVWQAFNIFKVKETVIPCSFVRRSAVEQIIY